ncbi:hypothetical protein PMIN06_005080 [Paraphaeosphaeria minitans]
MEYAPLNGEIHVHVHALHTRGDACVYVHPFPHLSYPKRKSRKTSSMVTTRARKYGTDSPSQSPSPSQAQAQAQTLSSRRSRWAHLLHARHFQPVIADVLSHELPKYTRSTVLPASLAAVVRECVLILASAPSVLLAAVDGTLPRRMVTDATLQHEYAVVRERALVQPSIYVHLLVDEHGVAPTATQYGAIRETVLQYVGAGSEHHELAWSIDNGSPPPPPATATAASGYRKYLLTAHRSPQHVATLLRFCAGVEQRLARIAPADGALPLRYAPGECGYSVNAHVRLGQHRARQSSNYVMNLVEDICAYLHQVGRFAALYTMQPFIVSLLFRPQQAAIAEIFISGLMQVWVDGGGGLNAYPAGRSVASAWRVDGERWAEHEAWVWENTGVERNLRVQRERLEGDVIGLEGVAEEVWREALGSGDEDGDDSRDGDYVPEKLVPSLEGLELEEEI